MVVEIINYKITKFMFALCPYFYEKLKFQNIDKYQNLLKLEKRNFTVLRLMNNEL